MIHPVVGGFDDAEKRFTEPLASFPNSKILGVGLKAPGPLDRNCPSAIGNCGIFDSKHESSDRIPSRYRETFGATATGDPLYEQMYVGRPLLVTANALRLLRTDILQDVGDSIAPVIDRAVWYLVADGNSITTERIPALSAGASRSSCAAFDGYLCGSHGRAADGAESPDLPPVGRGPMDTVALVFLLLTPATYFVMLAIERWRPEPVVLAGVLPHPVNADFGTRGRVLVNRIKLQGMIVFDWKDRYGEALAGLDRTSAEARYA